MRVAVIGMIYKSPTYLEFMLDQMDRYCYSEKYDISKQIICNDASEKIISLCEDDDRIDSLLLYKDKKPDDYYLNRVYRAWNYAGFHADGGIIIFVNSDMAFSPGWLDNLLEYLDDNTIPTSRLVESGKMPSGLHGISKNFGRTASEYKEEDFLEYVREIAEPTALLNGLFMPCAFYKRDFIKSGGYPEGNIYVGGPGAINTPFVQSGDLFYFNQTGKTHLTIFDSIVYHMQEGELDE